MFGNTGTYFCSRMTVHDAAEVTAALDVILGVGGALFASFELNRITTQHEHEYNNAPNYAWIPALVFACSLLEVGLGLVLFWTTYTKSIAHCYMYIILSCLTGFCTPLFMFRFYLILVVYDLVKEYRSIENQTLLLLPRLNSISATVEVPGFDLGYSHIGNDMRRPLRLARSGDTLPRQVSIRDAFDLPPSYVEAINMSYYDTRH